MPTLKLLAFKIIVNAINVGKLTFNLNNFRIKNELLSHLATILKLNPQFESCQLEASLPSCLQIDK